MCLSLFKDEYFLLGSNNNELNFYMKDGIYINSISEGIDGWILAAKVIYSNSV